MSTIGNVVPVRIGPCHVCTGDRVMGISPPGCTGQFNISCPRCTRRGAEQLLSLIGPAPVATGPRGAA